MTTATIDCPAVAPETFQWAHDTLTDLRSYFDLTDAEFDALAAYAEGEQPGVTTAAGPTLRPFCETCGRELVARPPANYTPEAAWCGMWWDHPTIPGQIEQPGIGHTSSVVVPAPTPTAALAAQEHARAWRSSR